MRTIKLIVSDLHVGDGERLLDGFGERQQAALEGLLAAAGRGVDGPMGQAEEVELILNGDCFDFLISKPHDTDGVMHVGEAVEKLSRMIAAHGPFFETLGRFVRQPGRRMTIMPGNHDMELCFAEVREGILEGMGMAQDDGRICFCLTPGYRPLPDVYVEHGHAYHFWCCDRSGLWAAAGQVKTVNPQVMQLPLEARYVQHVAYPIVMHYPYLTRFAPSLGFARQTALLCLLNPAMLAEAVEHIWELLDGGAYGWPRTGLLPLARGLEGSPIALFDQAVKALMAFQRDAVARVPRWREPAGKKAALQAQVRGFMEVTMLRKTLSRVSKDMDVTRALARIFRLKRAATRDSVAAGMHTVLKRDPLLRYALAGHIHTERIDAIKSGTGEQQVYLNTGGWLRQLALPKPKEVTPKLVAWLREPDWEHMPLREVTPRHVFALVHAADGGPSRASLCLWEDGRNGHYRVLA